ncbi:response regulator transcription factor [Paenibacillus glycanilyticus]|uniref:DNA-binding response regulator n=1 Tax=Paenibacillus glycanilyticus TaxID=126569 RepID=A0ABQ6GD87_9BACL|nr:response regulator [Paenibacillus glycanilyticus]GLX67233.1 DNA-binding response regulator [Paenibacillus glycanilyticus]
MYSLLIIEDDDIIRRGIIKIVSKMDLPISSIEEASNGQEALEKIRQLVPDIIITDIMMPFLDGLKLLKQIREWGLPCRTIIISGFDEFSYAQEAIVYGVNAYLLKPVKKDKLYQSISKIIQELDKDETNRKPSVNHSQFGHDIGFVTRYLEEHYAEDIDLNKAASLVFMSPAYFSSLFKKTTGVSFIHYLQKIRVEESKKLLVNEHLKIYEVAEKVGFTDEKYFFRVFKNTTGLTPNEFRLMKSK